MTTTGDLTLDALLTVAGASVITTVLVGVLIKAAGARFDRDRFGPLLAIVVGIGVTLFAVFFLSLATRENVGQAILNGLLAGLSSIGLYETQRGVRGV